jgi:hypothetical protein
MELLIKDMAGEIPEGYSLTTDKVPIEHLFSRFDFAHVLVKARKEMLPPFLPSIAKTWENLSDHPDLFRVVSCQNRDQTKWAHQVLWKTTGNGYVLQNLSSNDYMAATPLIKFVLNLCRGKPNQTWYLPSNLSEKKTQPGYTEKMIGVQTMKKIHQSVPSDLCDTVEFNFMFAKRASTRPLNQPVHIKPVTNSNKNEFLDFMEQNEGPVFIGNEELDQEDLHLDELNEDYQNIGMTRKRQIYLAYTRKQDRPLGSAIVYEGPVGANLRFLENKTHLTVDSDLQDEELADVCGALLNVAARHYDHFYPNFIPIITREKGAQGLKYHGAQLHVVYHQHSVVAENSEVADYHLRVMDQRDQRIREIALKRENKKRRQQ